MMHEFEMLDLGRLS